MLLMRLGLLCAGVATAFHAPCVSLHVLHAPWVRAPGTAMGEVADELGDGSSGSTDGGTFFTTLDGRDAEGISSDGMIPPGEDLIENDLRRLFDLDSDADSMLDGSEMDDLSLM